MPNLRGHRSQASRRRSSQLSHSTQGSRNVYCQLRLSPSVGRVIAVIALAVALFAASSRWSQSASADDPPLRPPSPPRFVSLFSVDAAPAPYELALAVTDFD